MNKETLQISVAAIVSDLQRKLKQHRQASAGKDTRAADRYATALRRATGLRALTKVEIKEKYPELAEHDDAYGCAAITEEGEVLLFKPGAAKGLAGKRRLAGISYVRDILSGKHSERISTYQNRPKLPEHVRRYLFARGIDANAVEVLNCLLHRADFSYQGTAFKFSTRWKKEIRKRMDYKKGNLERHLFYSPDPEHRETDQIQITLPGKPKVRVVKKGVSVGRGLPESLRLGFAGKPVATLIEIPGLEDMIIDEITAYSDKITQFTMKSD